MSATMPDNLPDRFRLTLRYVGRDVDNGTMSIEEVAEALSGLSGAYGKVASYLDPKSTHQLRLTGIDHHSFDLLVTAFVIASQGAEVLGKIKTAIDTAKHIITVIVDVVRAKKHTQGKPYTISVKGNNNTLVVVNANGAELALPPDALEILKSKLIDPDLRKISDPLESEKIDAAEIIADEGISATINASEKDYFDSRGADATTKETDVIGKFVSLNKERNRGTFRLGNNVTVPYNYIGENREKFHTDFSYAGTVKARVIAEFNQDLVVVHLDIISIEPLQGRLELKPPETPTQ